MDIYININNSNELYQSKGFHLAFLMWFRYFLITCMRQDVTCLPWTKQHQQKFILPKSSGMRFLFLYILQMTKHLKKKIIKKKPKNLPNTLVGIQKKECCASSITGSADWFW